MSYNKNQKLELDIIDMTKDGLGVAKKDLQVFFVKDAVPGDKVSAVVTKVTSNVIYAKTLDVISKSKYRVEPMCKVANRCGGCKLLNLDYDKQIELKKENTLNTISKIGKFDKDLLHNYYDGILTIETKKNYRNKMQVPFGMKNGEVVYGFYAGRTHHIVEFDNCVVGFKYSDIILKIIKENIAKHNISIYDENTGEGIFREVMLRKGNSTHEISITYILNDKNVDKHMSLYQSFDTDVLTGIEDKLSHLGKDSSITSTINVNTSNNNVLFGKENIVLSGKGYIEDNIGTIRYHISPESFYQVNIEMTKKLYDKIIDYADFKGNENVLDLYCGIGTISLYVARNVKSVLGVEIVDKAVENAKENTKLNSITNAHFICLDTSKLDKENIKKCNNTLDYDTVIVDPPRSGLDGRTLDFIKDIDPEKIIYVSCDLATLARDLDFFCHNGGKYILKKFLNVDMFPHTMHIETVALLHHI